ncbi:MAG: hypothetical protein ACREM1_17955 [Longimicrobiales bacterium]
MPTAQSLPEDVAQVFDGLASDGKALIGTRSLSALLPSTDRFPLLIMERDGGMGADTIATLDQNHASAVFIALAGGGTWRPSGRNSGIPSPDQIRSIEVASQPFSDITLWDVTSAGESVVVVDRNAAEAPGDHAYTFTGVRLSGNTVFSVRRAYEPIEIPAAVTDSIVGPYTRNFDEAEIRDVLFLPAFYPPVDAVVAGRDGTIWLAREAVVGESTQSTQRWDVFDEAGETLATLDLSAGLTVYDAAADAIWGVETDELDVPYVVRIPVRPAP